MSPRERLIKARVGMLALADELKNMPRARRLASVNWPDLYVMKCA